MRITASFLALILSAAPVAAEKLSLNAISKYLNGLQSSKSEFTQINDDGTLSTGTLSIKRPGRARFDYNPPEQAFVVVGGGAVAIFDGKTRTPPEQYPIGQTPLKVILQKNVNLSQSGVVIGHRSDGPTTTVIAQDPKNPEYGTIELVFTAEPVELRQWIIRNDGGETTVILGEMDKKVRLPNGLFSIQSEIQKLGG